MSGRRKDEHELEPKMHGDGAAEEPRREGRQVMRGDGADEVPDEEPRMTGSGAVEREDEPEADDPPTPRPVDP
jgi:hypothetical protein